MSELFDTSTFSSLDDATRDFEIEGNFSKKKMQKSSYKSDSAWDDGSAFPEISSSETWTIGDRIAASGDDKLHPSVGTVTGVNKKITVRQNGLSAEYTPKQMQSYGYYKFFSQGETLKAIEEKGEIGCNSHNLISAQELVQDSASLGCNTGLTLSEPQRLTNTAQTSLICDIQKLTTTETCKVSLTPEVLGYDQEQSISLQLPHHAPHSPQKAIAKEQPTSEIVSPQSLKSLINTAPSLQQSKTSQVCSLVPTSLEMSAVTSGMFYSSFPPAGMMRNGLLSEADTVPLPSLDKEYCWLPSPGALSFSGKGRPPGQTKQEGGLKDLGLLQKGEVLNPDILCEWYGLPPNWLDPSESRAATELLENKERQQEICLIPELQRSPSTELSISTHYAESQPLARANAQPETYIIDQSQSLGKVIDNLGFGFTVDWLDSSNLVTYNWERDEQQIIGLAIAPQHLIDKFFSQGETLKAIEDNHPQLCTKCLKVVDRDYTCEKCPPIQRTHQSNNVHCPSCESPLLTLNNGCGVCGWIPKNFLEKSQPQPEAVQKPKGKQRKGCLYKYIENKKLKDGTIASYPRVIGHRQPDNPTHWRWGFNWEEKVDSEWKGRSIGSVPLGALASTPAAGIALIQSMQNEGVPLEEIIGFIKRAKAKK